uniref:Uncharacterized protein n=1 Tax=Magnetococcus massalia (strain MO-1) TaxID=451514 RepID=A0A1S7LFX0_MAGMO|nr:conserved protein of unknown function [Candidatus Magnetococcus massalia]
MPVLIAILALVTLALFWVVLTSRERPVDTESLAKDEAGVDPSLLEANPHPMLLLSENGHVHYANRAAGLWFDLWHGDATQQVLEQGFWQTLQGELGEQAERRFRTQLGDRHYALQLIKQPALRQLLLYGVDISDQVNTEADMQSLARFPEENANPVARLDGGGRVLYANSASASLLKAWGMDAENQLAQPWQRLGADTLAWGEEREMHIFIDGDTYLIRLAPIADANYVNLYALKVTERVVAERRALSLARFPEENDNPVLRVDREGYLRYANPASKALLQMWQMEGQGAQLPEAWRELVGDAMHCGCDKTLELTLAEETYAIRLAPVVASGYVNLYGANITERKYFEEQLLHQANHDQLTGLPNQSLLEDRLQRAVQRVERGEINAPFAALFYLGVDHFEELIQSMGRSSADRVIQQVAERLDGQVPETATLGRLGSDLFGIVLHVSDPLAAADSAASLLALFDQPFAVNGDHLALQASIGIALFPHDGYSLESLTHGADLALYRAKGDPGSGYRFYEQSMDQGVMVRHTLLKDMRIALKEEQFEVYYQPQVDPHEGRLIGMEALVRWRHPEEGMISPGVFIPLAEESGLIIPLGRWVLHTACMQNKAWQDAGLPPLKVAVNLSSVQFGDPDLVDAVKRSLTESGLDPQWLDLEITESVAMQGAEETMAVLTYLKATGATLSIDDFGTGYSSLAYLKRFPVHKVKIDQSFVQGIDEDEENAAICRAVIELGHSLGLKVIAEGVEEAEELEKIRQMGCDLVQGYWYSKPLDEKAFASYVADFVVKQRAAGAEGVG